MGGIGGWEIFLIFLVILLVFGAKRIPEIARGLGKGIREFKDATTNIKSELSLDDDHRINSPRQGSTMPRQDTYQSQQPYQQPTPPPQQAPPPQAPPQHAPPPPESAGPTPPSNEPYKTHSPD